MKRIMKKPSLNEYGITASQYANYQDYKTKKEDIKRGRETFEHRFYKRVVSAISITFIFLLVIVARAFLFNTASYMLNNETYGRLFLFTLAILIPAILLFFAIRFIIGESIVKKIQPLKIHKPFKKLYTKLQASITEEPYFDKAKEYELQNEKYYNYIGDLHKRFPEIIDYNNNLQHYYKATIDEIIKYEHTNTNKSITNRELEKRRAVWLEMQGVTFEREVSAIYRELGYKTKTTKAIGEGGVDIRLWKDEVYSIVQCKNVLIRTDEPTVKSLLETMQKESASKAILICSGGFTPKARDFSKRKPVELLDLNQFLELVNIVYPQEYKLINTVSEISISNTKTTYTFKVIGKTYILLSSHTLSEDTNYCLFETRGEAKKTVKRLRKIENIPLGNSPIYDIEEWWLGNKPSDYYSKAIYYIKVRDREKKSFTTKKRKENNKHLQKELWPKEEYIQKNIWGAE